MQFLHLDQSEAVVFKQNMLGENLFFFQDKGGISKGSCAAGFGVCCTFVKYCDSETRENGTIFEKPTTNVLACR